MVAEKKQNGVPKQPQAAVRVKYVGVGIAIILAILVNVLTTKTPSVFDDNSSDVTFPPKFEYDGVTGTALSQIIRDRGEWFCQNRSSESSIQGTKKVHIKPLLPGRSQAFDILVYGGITEDLVSTYITLFGSWEKDILEQMASFFDDYAKKHNLQLSDLTFVDVGANIGWFTLSMAAIGVNVIAFEPMEQNLRLLRSSLCLNKDLAERITVVERGLSTETTTCLIYSWSNNIGNGNLECHDEKSAMFEGKRWGVRGQIKTVRLDDLSLDTLAPHTVVVKMDVEGFEGHVVEGGSNFFFSRPNKIPYFFSEFWPSVMADKGSDPRDFMRSFLDNGYSVFEHHKKYDREEALDMNNFPGAIKENYMKQGLSGVLKRLFDRNRNSAGPQNLLFQHDGSL